MHGSHPDQALPSDPRKQGAPDCFMALPGRTCKGTDTYIRSLAGRHQLRAAHHADPQHIASHGAPEWMQTRTTEHALGADAQMGRFFATQQIIDLATEYVRPDLQAFGYPVMQLTNDLELKH